MVTVACVLRTGGIYTREWVYALKRGLNEHLTDYRFRCLTNDPHVPKPWRIPLEHDWPVWWSKVELFRPGLFSGPVLYLDLDTLPVGDLTPLTRYDGRLAVMSDFIDAGQMSSGVMIFQGERPPVSVYRTFRKDPEGVMQRHGIRSDYWYRKVMPDHEYIQDLYPFAVASFKRQSRGGPPATARLVCGHGDPRFDSPESGWAHDLWRERSGIPETEEAA